MGLRTISQLMQDGRDGLYGPLYQLFEIVDDKFNIAVNTIAGSRYCVLCDTNG